MSGFASRSYKLSRVSVTKVRGGKGKVKQNHVIDLFFSSWVKKKEGGGKEAICKLHFLRDVNPFFPDKIHGVSAQWKGRKYGRVSSGEEELIRCRMLLRFVTNIR